MIINECEVCGIEGGPEDGKTTFFVEDQKSGVCMCEFCVEFYYAKVLQYRATLGREIHRMEQND